MAPILWYFFSARIPFCEGIERLLIQFQSFEAIWSNCDQHTWVASGLSQRSWQRLQLVHVDAARYEDVYRTAEQKGIAVVLWTDEDYPQLLKEIYHPPLALCVSGQRSFLTRKMVAVVGTRQSTLYGKTMVQGVVEALAPYQLVFVSGMAFGIDSEVHRSAHRLQLPSIGVIAAHLEATDWGGNRSLRTLLTTDDALFLSETTSDEALQKFHFARRNRLIAGLCQWIIVVEAPHGSGALITARYARDENRDVLCIPHALTASQGEGCNTLIAEGAQMITSLSALPTLLGMQKLASPQRQYQYQNEQEARIHQALLNGSSLDTLQRDLSIPTADLLSVISKLVLRGYLEQEGDGVYRGK